MDKTDKPLRVAAIYDIHGNLPALEAVLAEIRGLEVDLLMVGGDVVPGPMPGESLDCLLELEIPTRFIYGNGDREVLARMRGSETTWFRSAPEAWREPVSWTAGELDANHRQELASWPATRRLEIGGLGEVLFCHATPRSDIECFSPLTPEKHLLPIFEEANASLVVCGHTHLQFQRSIGRTRVVNAGSVGMPFGKPGAYWLLLDSDCEVRHTPYDLEEAASRILHTCYPQARHFAENSVLHPPSEQQAIEMY